MAKAVYGHWQCKASVRISFLTLTMQCPRKGYLPLEAMAVQYYPRGFFRSCESGAMSTSRLHSGSRRCDSAARVTILVMTVQFHCT